VAQDSEFEDRFFTMTENAEDMQGNGKTSALDPLQEFEKKRPGLSMPVCVAVPLIQTEFLIPWISTMSLWERIRSRCQIGFGPVRKLPS